MKLKNKVEFCFHCGKETDEIFNSPKKPLCKKCYTRMIKEKKRLFKEDP